MQVVESHVNFDERRYRPMKLLDLLDESLDLYKRTFAQNLLISALVYLPVVYFSSHLFDRAAGHLVNTLLREGFDSLSDHLDELIEYFGKAILMGAVSTNFIYCAICTSVSMSYLGHRPSMRQSLLTGLKFFLQSLVINSLWFILLLVGLMLCILPGIFVLLLGASLQCYVHVMIVEKQINPYKALLRSWNLSKGGRGLLVAADLLMIVFSVVVSLALSVGLNELTELSVGSAAHLIPALSEQPNLAPLISGAINSVFMLPFNACVMTMLYFNLRVQSEGFDMEILARRLKYLPDQVFSPPMAGAVRPKKKRS
jgi:hypothetical protein